MQFTFDFLSVFPFSTFFSFGQEVLRRFLSFVEDKVFTWNTLLHIQLQCWGQLLNFYYFRNAFKNTTKLFIAKVCIYHIDGWCLVNQVAFSNKTQTLGSKRKDLNCDEKLFSSSVKALNLSLWISKKFTDGSIKSSSLMPFNVSLSLNSQQMYWHGI